MNYISRKSPFERAFWVILIMLSTYVLAHLYLYEPLQEEYEQSMSSYRPHHIKSRAEVFKSVSGKLKGIRELEITNLSNQKGLITLWTSGTIEAILELLLLLERNSQIYISSLEIVQQDVHGADDQNIAKVAFRILDLESFIYKKRSIKKISLLSPIQPESVQEEIREATQEEHAEEKLELEAIINKSAKISGRWVGVGDDIGSYKVSKIMLNSVLLESKDGQLNLEFR